ncbi:T9SS type A sorting domain-containing protein [Labilibacter marinus]|uniref:T9SS type A sorting domain-containing protein n=1 Tax=Labilibacter marinus TaxID=1477105 RepID=UPI00094FC18B|nr:T9SS type A sorting domain-containing protein [Labilibacter marinus]
MKNIFTIILLLTGIHIFAQPALPELGYRWVLENNLSDEFDGSSINTSLWMNTDSRWIGREPGLFMAEAVTVDEGNLRMTTDIFDEPKVVNGKTWTHQGSHVRSINKVKLGSFIECRMKANKTFMSSTFWLINYSNESADCQRRTTELDVQECIGYPSTHAKTTQMGSNTHSRGIPESCTHIPAGSVGNHAETNGKVYDNYFNYGVWWKSPTEILFYLDGEYKYTIKPAADFDIDMYIKLVCETYNWSPPPADGGMTGTWEERTTFYEWVRTYSYVPVEQSDDNTTDIFTEEILFTEKPAELDLSELNFKFNYKANSDKKIVLELKDGAGAVVASAEKDSYAGYAHTELGLTGVTQWGDYTIEVSMYNKNDNTIVDSESYSIKVKDKDSAVVNQEALNKIRLSPNPSSNVVVLDGLISPSDYEIYTISGSLLKSGNVLEADSVIDISDLSPATYLVKVITNYGIKSLKFIKV